MDKIKFIETFYANVHHAIIVPWSIYNLVNSSCKNAYPLIAFFDTECFIGVDKNMVYLLMFTLTHFTIDVFIYELLICDKSAFGT